MDREVKRLIQMEKQAFTSNNYKALDLTIQYLNKLIEQKNLQIKLLQRKLKK